MKSLSRTRIEARDRRMAAVHEAGHLVLARHFRIVRYSDDAQLFPHARIWPNTTSDPTEKTWLGQCRDLSARALGPVQRRMFGIAGCVAELAWRVAERALCDDDVIECLYDYDGLSQSDRSVCGPYDEQLERAALRVASLFDRNTGKLWPELVRVSRRLIVESRGEYTDVDAFLDAHRDARMATDE